MNTEQENVNAYLRTKAMSASPEELRLMLLDGAIKFATQGREGLVRKDYEASFNGFSRCRNIIVELINAMRPDIDPDLCAKVSGLYTFMYTELLSASMEKSPSRVDKVIELLVYERDTWIMLMDQLSQERATAAVVRAAAHDESPEHSVPAPGEYRPISIQG